MMLSGWGRYPAMACKTSLLREEGKLQQIIESSTSLIARGNGRAYGDAALNQEMTLLMGGCDRLLAFDSTAGVVECEAGLLLSDLLSVSVPRGWFAPVVPGTKYVTIGGLIAADVHGKNHHLEGSFGRYVDSLRLALADGNIVTCSRGENSELFAATLGGMGLTGIIVSARFRLRPVVSALVEERVIRAPSLKSLLELFEENHAATYSVAWIDCLVGGSDSGRALLTLGEHATEDCAASDRHRKPHRMEPKGNLAIPVELPFSLLNRWSIRLFNALYYRLQNPRRGLTHYDRFFFPLDAIQNWNRFYGRRGFVQYQCVVRAEEGLRRILNLVPEIGHGSFLAVLKKLGPGNRFLSFPMEGYTLTLDFPARADTIANLTRLDAVVAEFGGRIYLAKDARAPRDVIEHGYPEIDTFRALRLKIDPNRKFRSALSERLGL